MEKRYRISVEWESCGIVKVKANSLEEAIKIAKEDTSIGLPEGNYIDGSWKVNEEMSEYFAKEK